jgi:hypothetical protein
MQQNVDIQNENLQLVTRYYHFLCWACRCRCRFLLCRILAVVGRCRGCALRIPRRHVKRSLSRLAFARERREVRGDELVVGCTPNSMSALSSCVMIKMEQLDFHNGRLIESIVH